MTSFFVNLPSNRGPQTFPNNTAATFDTKLDLVRQLDGEWSVALVAMSHPAKMNNMVNRFHDVMTLLQYGRLTGENGNDYMYQMDITQTL